MLAPSCEKGADEDDLRLVIITIPTLGMLRVLSLHVLRVLLIILLMIVVPLIVIILVVRVGSLRLLAVAIVILTSLRMSRHDEASQSVFLTRNVSERNSMRERPSFLWVQEMRTGVSHLEDYINSVSQIIVVTTSLALFR